MASSLLFARRVSQNIRLRQFSKLANPKLRYKAVIGDVGDTILSGAPMIRALQMAMFNSHGVVMHPVKLYKDFGKPKNEQIQTLLLNEFGQAPAEQDVHLVEAEFTYQLIHHYETYGAQYLPGTLEGMHVLRKNGIMFGCTTGLSDKVIDAINISLPKERPWPIVYGQRPSTDAIHKILQTWNVGLRPMDRIQLKDCIKVGDSLADLAEAKQAGIPFIGIVAHRAEAQKVPKHQIADEFERHGASMCVDTLYDVAVLICPKEVKRTRN